MTDTAPLHVAGRTPTSLAQSTTPSGLEELARLVEEQRRLSTRQCVVVAELVAHGTSWPVIAATLGVSRQAARQRFLRTHGHRP